MFYDILDYPWERQYKMWRPQLISDAKGRVLEAGVGTGQNLPFYSSNIEVHAIDLSPAMLSRAQQRGRKGKAQITYEVADATELKSIPSNSFDWYISTFMYCVIPDELQASALIEMMRVLRPGGQFRILEILYSKDAKKRRKQDLIAPFVQKVYGARFDRKTLEKINQQDGLEISSKYFLKDDTYLLIEGTNTVESQEVA